MCLSFTHHTLVTSAQNLCSFKFTKCHFSIFTIINQETISQVCRIINWDSSIWRLSAVFLILAEDRQGVQWINNCDEVSLYPGLVYFNYTVNFPDKPVTSKESNSPCKIQVELILISSTVCFIIICISWTDNTETPCNIFCWLPVSKKKQKTMMLV